jgi:hypothetical protein
MRIQVQYLQAVAAPYGPDAYTFDGPDDTAVGDPFWDRRSIVQVVALGSRYSGRTRTLNERVEHTATQLAEAAGSHPTREGP